MKLRFGFAALKVAGFGACMITGYPHKGGGLFDVACGLTEKRLSRPVQSTIVSLGGFPAPRAEKYLKKKVFDFNPQYVVIQFGPTDAQCPIRAGNRATDRCSELSADDNYKPSAALSYHGQSATLLSLLRWQIASLNRLPSENRAHNSTILIHRCNRAYGGRLPFDGHYACGIVPICLRITIYK